MSTIISRQNELEQIKRLAAQRELYSSAKRFYNLQIIGTVIIPIFLAVLGLFKYSIAIPAAVFGIVFFLLDLLFISPAISKRKLKAARIQELFDCYVLQIQKSTLKMSSDETVETVLKYYNAYKKIRKDEEKLKNWYPSEVGKADIPFGRLICQRINCWWDAGLREKYILALRCLSIIIPLLLLVFGVWKSLPSAQLVLIFGSLIPLFRFANKEYTEHKTSTTRLEGAQKYIDKLWLRLLSGETACVTDADIRSIQDEIFENRSRSPFVLDKIYWLLRSKNELEMQEIAASYVRQIPHDNQLS